MIERERFEYLNGLKGIASLVILIYHYIHFIEFGAIYDDLALGEYIGFIYKYGFYAVDAQYRQII